MLIDHASGSPAEGEAYFEWLRQRTLGVLRHKAWWSCVERLADELQEVKQRAAAAHGP